MADTIKIGNLSISAFKVGSSDCKIYLGSTKLYPTTKNYFRFVSRGSGTFTLFPNGSSSNNNLSYSLDSGSTWSTLTNGSPSPTLNSGDTIMLKGSNLTIVNGKGIGTFSSTTQFDVEGNIMSLLYGDDFEDKVSLNGKYSVFMNLFSGCTSVINTENMELPATTLSTNCYTNMFNRCTSLVTSPRILPATTLTTGCYYNMFYSIASNSSLTSAPILPAETLVQDCYRQMFYNRNGINEITCLATDISASNCTTSWMVNVASSGTFYKASSMTSWGTCGTSKIPCNWTVQDYVS